MNRLRTDVDHATYHRDEDGPRLSQSIAHWLLTRSPSHAHAHHPRLGGVPAEPTAAMTTGALLHALLLGRREIVDVEAEDYKTKAAREARDAALARGAIPVTAPVLTRAILANRRIREQLAQCDGDDADLADIGRAEGPWHTEVAAYWEDAGGVRCRGMLDIFDNRCQIADVKFVRSAQRQAFAAAIERDGYDVQAAAYIEAIETIYPERAGRVRFRWLVCEKDPPYVIAVYSPDVCLRDLGRRKWERAKRVWSMCLAESSWPGYRGGEIAPVAWASNDDIIADLEDSEEEHA